MVPPSPENAEAARRQREQYSQPTPVQTVPVDMPAVPVALPAAPTSAEVAVSCAACGIYQQRQGGRNVAACAQKAAGWTRQRLASGKEGG